MVIIDFSYRLSISKSLLALMDGSPISICSEVGKGSDFSFTLPLPYCQETQQQYTRLDPEMKIPLDKPSDIRLGPKRLLLAEDVPINREIVIALLEGTGFTIDIAANGEEAVQLVNKQPDKYDAILMDIQMPKMCGIEATKTIRNLPGRQRNLPIIALTANVFAEDIEAYLHAGMNDHISKPILLDNLLSTLQKHL